MAISTKTGCVHDAARDQSVSQAKTINPSVTLNVSDARLTTVLPDLGLRRATRGLAARATRAAVSYPLGVVNISTTARRISVWTVGTSVSVTRRVLACASTSRARAKVVVKVMTGSVPTALRVIAAGRR